MGSRIALAESDQEILICHPIMAELRSHIQREQFVSTVKRLAEIADYRMAYLTDGDVKAIAGFRISEWLAGGRYLELEDLVVASNERSKGYGGELFDWLVKHAEENNCDQIRLISRVTRYDAHRFYLNKRMIIEAYYFSRQLK